MCEGEGERAFLTTATLVEAVMGGEGTAGKRIIILQ